MLNLSSFLTFNNIVIQCHNVPDADALASGFGLYKYFESKGKSVLFAYGGREKISKANLVFMIRALGITVVHVTDVGNPDLLITVDCQYGESNVQTFQAKEVCVIDHHEVSDWSKLPCLNEVMENYGSCSTVVYGMLKAAGYDIGSDKSLQTALYYGLYMDTSRFEELWHPADKDMWDELKPDQGIIDILRNTNMTAGDMEVIGRAFSSHTVNERYRYGVVEVETGDPNILGIVSDTYLGVDSIDTSIAYSFIRNGVKLSVRTCKSEIRADELAKVLTQGIGGGGGHLRKAGGFVMYEKLAGDNADRKKVWEETLHARLKAYFDNTDTIRAGDTIDLSDFDLYCKLPVSVGVADLNGVFGAGDKVRVRTLEGDIDVFVSPEHYLMIGVQGEVYPIKKASFLKNYRLTGQPYKFFGEYIPAVRDHMTGRQVSLSGIAKECMALGTSLVYAKQLSRRTHVFTIWDPQRYISGEEGDWIAIQKDNQNDVYIISKHIFTATYEKAPSSEE